MFCPKCGQQQVSDDVSFCPRCGLPLGGVKQLLAADGRLPALEQERGKPRRSPRREGVRQGVLLMFICLILLPLADAIDNNRLDFLPQIFVMAGLVRILYAVFFQEGAPRRKRRDGSQADASPAAADGLGGNARRPALPPEQGVPVARWQPRVDTAEMVERPSVTEHTTKLLDDSPGRK